MHIGIVVGEASGDILGASLLAVLKQRFPSCHFSGIGGERMLDQGFESLFAQDRLAVMGFIEPLKRLPELLHIRKNLYHHFVNAGIDLFVGIDSPDFTIPLEKKLRQKNIKTVHYVSPSVWAWRQGRIKGIKSSVDWMLTLLPFEAAFYEKNNIPVTFVGHPLADQFPLVNDTQKARKELSVLLSKERQEYLQQRDVTIIACLPGSRRVEVEHIGPTLWQAMSDLSVNSSSLHCLVPALNTERREQIEEQLSHFPQLSVSVVDGYSQTVMAAADCVVMASGTTTLEAMLLKKPMVVVYKKDALSYWLISRMLTVDHVSLPNLLAGEEVVPELIQDAATPEAISKAVQRWLENPSLVVQLQQRFTTLHQQLTVNASETAADVIEHLLVPKSVLKLIQSDLLQ
jgi:lipid-A-disaccharide synthase